MTTFRVAQRHRYTTVDQATINDDSLTYRARGILVWLLDKPDNWTVSAEAIARHGGEGRDAVRTALEDLRTAGYIRTDRKRDARGRWTTESVVYERPHHDGFPAPVNQRRATSAGKPGPISKTDTNDYYQSSSSCELQGERTADDDEDGDKSKRDDRLARAQAACDLVGQRAFDNAMAGGGIRNPSAYRDECLRSATRDHLGELQLRAHEDRAASAEKLAEAYSASIGLVAHQDGTGPHTAAMAADWEQVRASASQGNHCWLEHPELTPCGRAAASEIASTIRSSSIPDARAAFFDAWKRHASVLT